MTDKTDKLTTPAPGQYKIKAELFKVGNNTVIGKEKRNNDEKEKMSVPAPGVYGDLQKQALKLQTHQGNRIFGKQERSDLAMKTVAPGPGRYSSEAKIRGPKVNYIFNKYLNSILWRENIMKMTIKECQDQDNIKK